MRDMRSGLREVDICKEKLEFVLNEFNCGVEYDEELEEVIIVDKDNSEFEYMNKTNLERFL